MTTTPPDRACEQCGADMEVEDSWSRKSPPLIGTTVEHVEYRCTECGAKDLFKREGEEGDWQEA